jgi:hypothetical protein
VDEVVLAVVERLSGPPTAAPRQLVAFTREHLHGWDRDKVSLSFDVDQLAVHAGRRQAGRPRHLPAVGRRREPDVRRALRRARRGRLRPPPS